MFALFVLFITFVILWFMLVYVLSPSIEVYMKDRRDSIPIISLERLYGEVDNGDILFLSGSTYGEKTIRWYTQSNFNHSLLIVKDRGEIFAWESDLGSRTKDGPRVIRLKDKLSKWKGECFGMLKRFMPLDGKRPTLKEILSIVEKYIEYDMDRSMVSWLFADYPDSWLFRYFKPEKSVFCSELVALTLQELNILPKDRVPSWYSPEHLAVDRVPPLKGVYGVPVYFEIATKR